MQTQEPEKTRQRPPFPWKHLSHYSPQKKQHNTHISMAHFPYLYNSR